MEFKISYEDNAEHPIDFNPNAAPRLYFKVYSLNGVPKKKEYYFEGQMKSLSYYLDPDEILEKVLIENQGLIEIRTREYVGDYLKVHYDEYYEGMPRYESGSLSVYDKSGNEIYFSSGTETEKSFFENDEKLYSFFYKNGKLINFESYNSKHKGYTNEDEQQFPLEELPNLEDLDWEKMTYFHNAEPVIPEIKTQQD